MPLWVGISWKASGLGASEQTKVRQDYVCCLVIICGTWTSKEVGRGFLNLSYGGKGKSNKQEELLWGAIKKLPKELTTELHYLELPAISASCGVKRYMHDIRFLLAKTQKQRSLNQFFLQDLFLFTLLILFINLQVTTE